MAFKDGMNAISKVLRIIAVVMAVCGVGVAVAGGVFGSGGVELFFGSLFTGIFLFLLFWTPSWIINKFIQ